jgi:membrane glycosyltransferase
MVFRRLLLLSIVLASAAGLDAAMWVALAPGGWTGAKVVMMGSFALATPWVGFYVANGLIGFVILLVRGAATPPWDADPPPPADQLPRTALAVTVRHEDMGVVLPPLRRLLDALDARGVGDRFAVCVLSDTADPTLAAIEEQAVAAFRAADRDPTRVRYRRRTSNTGYKAGNVMDFLDHHAAGFEVMVPLDADSQMSARAVLRLVGILARDKRLALVQHLTVGLPARSPFPRLFQFGMRAGMRTWATALAWWQGDQGCYWGHNAAFRIAAFRAHARLPLLPGGRTILSHDQVEAALLAGAGWGVRLIPEEDGSAEANPPAFPEFVQRDMRWLAGNLEYRHLLSMPGLKPMGRWQFIQAILLFGCAPLYLVLLLAAAWAALTDATSPFPLGAALVVASGWVAAIYAPKLLGYLELLLSRRKRARYGGGGRILVGGLLEMAFAMIIDPITLVNKTETVLRLLAGRPAGWPAQNRGDRGVPWSEAVRLFWPQTVLGVAVFAAFASAGPMAVLLALPLAGGLLVAIPFCVLSADPRIGAWLQAHGIAAIPEELGHRTKEGSNHG